MNSLTPLAVMYFLFFFVIIATTQQCFCFNIKRYASHSRVLKLDSLNTDFFELNIPSKKLIKSTLLATVLLQLFSTNAYSTTEKEGKNFELCLSKCVFSDTRPPPIGSDRKRLEATRTRVEILHDCKVQCATSKEQLLTGKPKLKVENNNND
jgi:hypothetical protein